MTTAVIVDSAAALPDAVAARHGVRVVPIGLTIGASSYRDGELSLDEVLDRLDEGVSTSGPTPGDFVTAITAALAEADTAVVLTVAAAMSSTHQAAVTAAGMVDGDVRVVDTGTAAGAEALVALAAARRAAAGGDAAAVEAAARDVIGRVRLVATVEGLDRLARSGRVPAAAAWAGRQLGVNPLFELRQGKIGVMRPAMSRDAALDRIAATCRASKPEGPARLHAVGLHVRAPDAARRLVEAVVDDAGEWFVGPFSPAMVVHTGPGLAGLAWWWEPGRGGAR